VLSHPAVAVTVGVNFDGFAEFGSAPPDPNAAVGPNYVVEFVNGDFGLDVFTKTGMSVQRIGDSTFWDWQKGGDGHIVYDEIARRWVYTEIGTADAGTGVMFAVSDTSDPTGPWTEKHFFEGFVDGTGMGYNADAYFWRHAQGTWIVEKSSVLDADNTTYASQLIPQVLGAGPALIADAKPGDPYWSLDTSDSSGLTIDEITGALSGSPTYQQFHIAVPGGGAGWINAPVNARGGRMIVASNFSTGIQWDLVDLTGATPALVQNGVVQAPPGTSLGYASGALAPNGDIGIEYLQYYAGDDDAGTGSYMAIMATGRAASDPPNTMQAPIQIYSGSYTDGRTGDYSSVSVDIDSTGAAKNVFWGCNMYLTSSSIFDWGTRIWSFEVSSGSVVDGGGDDATTSSDDAGGGDAGDAGRGNAGDAESGGGSSGGSAAGSSTSSSGTGGSSSSSGSGGAAAGGGTLAFASSGCGCTAAGSPRSAPPLAAISALLGALIRCWRRRAGTPGSHRGSARECRTSRRRSRSSL
jgi:hypothetical protein